MLDLMRGHGEGSLFRRKRDNRWVAKVSMPDGRRVSASDPDKAEAKRLLAELLRQRDAGATPDLRLTVGDYLRRWLDDVRPNLAPATWRKHESIIRVHLTPVMGHHRVSDLSITHVRRYLRETRLDPQTLRHHRGTLRRALADAVRDGLVTRNVAALAEPPKMTRRERTILDTSQVRAVIEGTRDDRMHALYVLALTTGMREAEMLGLAWKDVDLGSIGNVDSRQPRHVARPTRDDGNDHRGPDARGTGRRMGGLREQGSEEGDGLRGPSDVHLRVAHGPSVTVRSTLHRGPDGWQLREPKTPKSRRTIPLPPVTVAALREHRRRQLAEQATHGALGRDGLVFTTPTGAPIHGSNLLPDWYAHLERLGLPRVTLHACRHSCATMLITEGYPIAKVAAILGHSSSRVTEMIYAHLRGKDLADAADVIERAYGAG